VLAEKARKSISIEEFRKLSKTFERTTIPSSEILEAITDEALSTSQLADQFGLSYSAMYSRLKRMLKNGQVEVGYSEGNAYWLATGKPVEEEE